MQVPGVTSLVFSSLACISVAFIDQNSQRYQYKYRHTQIYCHNFPYNSSQLTSTWINFPYKNKKKCAHNYYSIHEITNKSNDNNNSDQSFSFTVDWIYWKSPI